MGDLPIACVFFTPGVALMAYAVWSGFTTAPKCEELAHRLAILEHQVRLLHQVRLSKGGR